MADPLGIVYTGDGGQQIGDGTGGAIKFGASKRDYSDLLKAVQMRSGKKNQYSDDVSAAQLGKAWSKDRPQLMEMYNEYLDAIKTYEKSGRSNADAAWKDLQNKKAGLVFAINKSEDDQKYAIAQRAKMYDTERMMYNDGDYQAFEDWINQPFSIDRKLPDIQKGTTYSAQKEYEKFMAPLEKDFLSVSDTDALGNKLATASKEIDVDKARERTKMFVEQGLTGKQRAARMQHLIDNPSTRQIMMENDQEKINDALVDSFLGGYLITKGDYNRTTRRAAPLSKDQKDRKPSGTSTGFTNKYYAFDLINRDGGEVITINKVPGANPEVSAIEVPAPNGGSIKGVPQELISPKISQSGKWEIVLSQDQTDRNEAEKTILNSDYQLLADENLKNEVKGLMQNGLTPEQFKEYNEKLAALVEKAKQTRRVTIPLGDGTLQQLNTSFAGGGLGTGFQGLNEFIKRHEKGAMKSATQTFNKTQNTTGKKKRPY